MLSSKAGGCGLNLIGVPRENQRPAASHWQTLSHNVVSSTSCHEQSSNLCDKDSLH
jgi:hypothetical protein